MLKFLKTSQFETLCKMIGGIDAGPYRDVELNTDVVWHRLVLIHRIIFGTVNIKLFWYCIIVKIARNIKRQLELCPHP